MLRRMERISRNQAAFVMFLLMSSVVVIDGLLESAMNPPLRTSLLLFSLSFGMYAILELAGAEKWPKTTLRRKARTAGALAVMPLLMSLFR
jgi:hypothetical protein